MDKKIKALNYESIRDILSKYDDKLLYEKVNRVPEEKDLKEELTKYIDIDNISTKSVLGIDIYRYSSYNHLEQTLIPFLFKILYKTTINFCLNNNQFIFQKLDEKHFKKAFLSTGDGGYLIMDTPLHSLLFAINFELMVRSYNSFHLYPKLRKIIGEISLRYAITNNSVYYFDDNFYGRSIINNARILEKDNLNRCLIDQDVYEWFQLNTDGTENLQVLTIKEIANIYEFEDYDRSKITDGKNDIISTDSSRSHGIINSDILKIGKIESKGSDLDIYNLHLQVSMNISEPNNDNNCRKITISLGNLNTKGF